MIRRSKPPRVPILAALLVGALTGCGTETFPCGDVRCQAAAEICLTYLDGDQTVAACAPAPAACAADLSCACLLNADDQAVGCTQEAGGFIVDEGGG
jgi:hypothetical protein